MLLHSYTFQSKMAGTGIAVIAGALVGLHVVSFL